MTVHVAILGIDGSGKSTLSAALPALLAAETGCRAGALGDHLLLVEPDRDLAAPGFEPEGVPLALRLARLLRHAAKRATGRRLAYPVLKVGHLACQEAAAHRLARRHRLDVMISDGNLPLSCLARAANYRSRPVTTVHPALDGWLPDVAVVLDVSPEEALQRIGRRGRPDHHENAADLAAARRGYHGAVDLLRARRPDAPVLMLPADGLACGEVAVRVVEFLSPLVTATAGPAAARPAALHRSAGVSAAAQALARLCNPRYSVGHLVLHGPSGAWRELCFPLSAAGRRLIREGYSAGVMRLIYDGDERGAGWAERAFLGYPLHRAARDRLRLLIAEVEAALLSRLERGPVAILTAPSGFAQDILRPLRAIAAARPELMERVTLVAADLDPDGDIEVDLRAAVEELGVRLRFHRGDLTRPAVRAELAREAPFDLALFVGLSSWLPKPDTVRHLRWVRSCLAADGLLVADCFSPAPHAVSGHHMGFRASYFEPATFAVLLDACGLDGLGARVRSGGGGHNHVLVAAPGELAAQPGTVGAR
jgi:thymidylate kinase